MASTSPGQAPAGGGTAADPLDMRQYRIDRLPKRRKSDLERAVAAAGLPLALLAFVVFGFLWTPDFLTSFDASVLPERAQDNLQKLGLPGFIRANAFMLALAACVVAHLLIVWNSHLTTGVVGGMQPRYYGYALPGVFIFCFLQCRNRIRGKALFGIFTAAAALLLAVGPSLTTRLQVRALPQQQAALVESLQHLALDSGVAHPHLPHLRGGEVPVAPSWARVDLDLAAVPPLAGVLRLGDGVPDPLGRRLDVDAVDHAGGHVSLVSRLRAVP